MEVNRDVTRRDILYGVLKRMDEVIDSISNTVSTKDFLVRDRRQDRIRFWQQAKIRKTPKLTPVSVTRCGRFFVQRPAGNGRPFFAADVSV